MGWSGLGTVFWTRHGYCNHEHIRYDCMHGGCIKSKHTHVYAHTCMYTDAHTQAYTHPETCMHHTHVYTRTQTHKETRDMRVSRRNSWGLWE